MTQTPPAKNSRFICLCNGVTQIQVEEAIASGCNSLGKLFDRTTAGAGPCGGTCQPTLTKMLESYQACGQFPENPRPPSPKRRDRGLKRKV